MSKTFLQSNEVIKILSEIYKMLSDVVIYIKKNDVSIPDDDEYLQSIEMLMEDNYNVEFEIYESCRYISKKTLFSEVLEYIKFFANINSYIYTSLPTFGPDKHYFYIYHDIRKIQRYTSNSDIVIRLKEYLDKKYYLNDKAEDLQQIRVNLEDSESEIDPYEDECVYDVLGNEL